MVTITSNCYSYIQISNVSIESNPPLPPPIIFSRKVTPLSSNPDSGLFHARKLITMSVACGIFHVDTAILPTHKNLLLQTPIDPTSSISSSHQCFDGNGSGDHNHNSTNISQVCSSNTYNY